eukprot:10222289-Heterocapsa_arctica.AAC.1
MYTFGSSYELGSVGPAVPSAASYRAWTRHGGDACLRKRAPTRETGERLPLPPQVIRLSINIRSSILFSIERPLLADAIHLKRALTLVLTRSCLAARNFSMPI